MCARYQAIEGPEPFAEYRLGWASARVAEAHPQMFPGRLGAVIRRRDELPGLDAMRWGLIPFWMRDADPRKFRHTFNARSETADRLPAFRTPFRSRRCLVPAEHFTEFPIVQGTKLEHRVRSRGGDPLVFAGLWDRWIGPDAEEILSFTILTTEAHAGLRWLHHRMPVVLPRAAQDEWLEPELAPARARELLISPTPEMIVAAPAHG